MPGSSVAFGVESDRAGPLHRIATHITARPVELSPFLAPLQSCFVTRGLTLRQIGRVIIGLLGLALALAAATALYQAVATAIDNRHYLPPGKLVDVGGYRLHLYCIGDGSPTVVMDAMGGGWSLDWVLVQPEVARFTRVCSYDRAGVGWSDASPAPRTSRHIAAELHTLLRNAGIESPYVMVGHSLGGYTVRVYADEFRREVVGVVLVDAGHEDELSHPVFRRFRDVLAQSTRLFRISERLGVPRLCWQLGIVRDSDFWARRLPKLPPDARSALRAGWYRSEYASALYGEDAALEESLAQVRASGRLGTMPLVVLTATGDPWWDPSQLPPGFPLDQLKEEWTALQTELLTLSSHSSQVLATQSSHFIPFDQPALVIDAIRRVVEEAR